MTVCSTKNLGEVCSMRKVPFLIRGRSKKFMPPHPPYVGNILPFHPLSTKDLWETLYLVVETQP